jgi:transposase
VLATIPGLSALLAARYLAGIGGDVTRFPSANHLWSYAGYDPIINDSGNGRYHGPISRRGSPYLRVTLFQMGFLASRHNPATARVYVRARDRGVGDVKRMQHAACSMLHAELNACTPDVPFLIPFSILHSQFSIISPPWPFEAVPVAWC